MPLSAETVCSSSKTIAYLQADDALYFLETRPAEKGRGALMKYDGTHFTDCLPPTYSMRSRVHEYGGRPFEAHGGRIFFVNGSDQGIYEIANGEVSLIYSEKGAAFGDLRYDPLHNCLFTLYEREDHTNTIASICLEAKTLHIVARGAHFYASIALTPDHQELAWVEWDHPHMPWDESRVVKSAIESADKLGKVIEVCSQQESSAQSPHYLLDGKLAYLWDRDNFWNLYQEGTPLTSYPADFAEPLWQFGLSRVANLTPSSLALVGTEKGRDLLALFDLENHKLEKVNLDWDVISSIAGLNGKIYLIGASSTTFSSLAAYDMESQKLEIIYQTQKGNFGSEKLSTPEAIECTNRHGESIYGFLYMPAQPINSPPPLIVKCHSGPTSRVTPQLNLAIQFFTTRGYAFLEVNYGGSTGYGRAFRNRLRGRWGELDVTDTIDAVTSLVQKELIDERQIYITGSSSGGLTALLAAAQSRLFSKCSVMYAVTDLIGMSEETHKFELHYLDSLIAPYPEGKALYFERSPLNQLENYHCPTLIFQGLQDRVVSPSQAKGLQEALLKRHVEAKLITFEEEGHSFRQAESKIKVLNESLSFYQSSSYGQC